MSRPAREPAHPTLRQQWLAHQLRELRQQRGLTLEEAAAYLGYDRSYLARCERSEWPFKRDIVLGLLDCYQVWDPDKRARLLREQEEAWRVDIFDTDFTGSIYDSSGVNLTWLEERAELICTYVTQILPGLLQSRDYAAAVMRLYDASDDPVDRWVERRMTRQQILSRAKPARLSAVIDESALRHPIGGPTVMRRQLAALVKAGGERNVEIRVLPPTAVRPEGAWGQFMVLQLPEPHPSVGYLENVGGRFYFESPKSKRFITAYHRLREAALSPGESAELIAAVAEEWA
ncbi:helix-turn-helix domain-containing protein [Plantactinospora sp. WMMC1484]|uniref:helix-turn-helix domain-containing protein n=1 Tax=Plantactinospora sp. WMMC1484 TaxID=3404122 RepID=UPI003BF5B993